VICNCKLLGFLVTQSVHFRYSRSCLRSNSEDVSRCTSGRERLREINSASTDKTPLTHPLELSSGNADVRLTHTEVRVGLPPAMPKPNADMIVSYSEHADSLVLVSGVAIGGAQSLLHKTRRNVAVHQRNPMSLQDIPTNTGSPDCVHSVYHQIGWRPRKHVKVVVELNSVSI
jgi:hypothetical protein